MWRACLLLLALGACARRSPEPAAERELADFSAPADARGWYLRALYAEAHGDEAEAERALAWALRLDRGNPWLWIASARLHERAGRPEEALSACATALERAPGFPPAHLQRGRLLLAAGRAAEAADDLKAAPPCDVADLLARHPSDVLVAVREEAERACPR